jgi:hypothetical protein
LVPFGYLVLALIEYLRPGLLNVNFKINEDLKNYFEAVDQDDRLFMITEEENVRDRYVSHSFHNVLFRISKFYWMKP